MNLVSPCHWPLIYPRDDLPEGYPITDDKDVLCPALKRLDAPTRRAVERMAIDMLWSWSGRFFGTCQEEVRPCRDRPHVKAPTYYQSRGGFIGGSPPQRGGWLPILVGGEWYNIACGVCPSKSSCNCGPDAASALVLPGPVSEIISVHLGGKLLPRDSWHFVNETLYLLEGVWPDRNNAIGDLLDSESGAWAITYMRGYSVPEGGQIAAGILACELAKAFARDSSCQLPSRVQSITREGVTMAILDEFSSLGEGRTGIWQIDAWLASVNTPRSSGPSVWSPDMIAGQGRMIDNGFGRRTL